MTREYPKRPIVGIGAVVLKDGHVLLIRRGKPPRPGSLSLPGGAQRVGETVFEGAVREVMEETGVEAEVLGLVDVVDSMTRDDEGRLQYHYTLIDVVCRWVAGEPVAAGDAADALWAPLTDVPELPLWSETRRIIELAAEMAEAIPPAD
ncbi:MAG: phosphohydrolase [Rhodospirillales bacterium CG15_BIG_FIL_POST_REV_8_21_14_020_66_15]|nr:MAG: phosphohydrolase [Rhodospirillales bacterium CG15_BIG_FIL_POST_REV_8_21_14_020_66_15]